jgi:hypothetical protein
MICRSNMLIIDSIKRGDVRRRGDSTMLRVGDYYFPLAAVLSIPIDKNPVKKLNKAITQLLASKTIGLYGLARGARLMEIEEQELSRLSGDYVFTITKARHAYKDILKPHTFDLIKIELGDRFTIQQLRDWLVKQII